jgi:hypothetical protein
MIYLLNSLEVRYKTFPCMWFNFQNIPPEGSPNYNEVSVFTLPNQLRIYIIRNKAEKHCTTLNLSQSHSLISSFASSHMNFNHSLH